MPFTVGYHGTTKKTADEIVNENKPFNRSKNTGDWLGAGVYFWQEAPYRADVWARHRHKGVETAVIAADIDLQRCLDLFDISGHKELRDAYPKFLENEQISGIKHAPQDELRVAGGRVFTKDNPKPIIAREDQYINFRDRAFIDWYIEAQESKGLSIGSVRGIFLVGKAVFTELFLFHWSNAQITVLDETLITNRRIHRF